MVSLNLVVLGLLICFVVLQSSRLIGLSCPEPAPSLSTLEEVKVGPF